MKKVALFVFNGDPMCFIHVLLNALDMSDRGYEVKIIIEGAATQLISELEKKGNPLHQLWKSAKSKGLVEGVCKACANKMERSVKPKPRVCRCWKICWDIPVWLATGMPAMR